MKTRQHVIRFRHGIAPVVEFDQAAKAWYIRVGKGTVARTIELDSQSVTATCDLDSSGNVLGIELIGVKEFSLRQVRAIIEENDLPTPSFNADNIRFKPTRAAAACV